MLLALPLQFNTRPTAILLDLLFLRCLEELLPANIQAIDKVAHIQQLLLAHAANNRGIEGTIDLAAIDNGGRALALSGLHAVKHDLHWPAMGMRTLVMEKDWF